MANSKNPARSADSSAILVVALEFMAVGVFTVIAGTSDEMGTLVILFMTGMWLIWLINNSAVLAGLENAMGEISKNG